VISRRFPSVINNDSLTDDVATTLNVSLISSSLPVNVNGSSEPVWYSLCLTDTMVRDPSTLLVE
jgi:hypothetical protein